MLLNITQLWMIYMYACFLLTEKWMNLDDSVSYPKVGVHIYIYIIWIILNMLASHPKVDVLYNHTQRATQPNTIINFASELLCNIYRGAILAFIAGRVSVIHTIAAVVEGGLNICDPATTESCHCCKNMFQS